MRLRGPARLRTRVLVGVVAVTLVALAAFDLVAVTALRGYLLGQADAQLKGVLAEYRVVQLPAGLPGNVAPEIRLGKAHPQEVRPRSAGNARRLRIVGPFAFLHGELGRFYVASADRRQAVFVGGNGSLIPRLPANLAGLANSGQPITVTSTDGRTPVRLMAESFPRTGIVYATTSLTDLNNTVRQIGLIMAIGSACAGLLAAAGTIIVMRRGLRPVEAMAAQADGITAGDLSSRVSARDARTEVGRLGGALNGMLARIHDFISEREASQQATRRFFADASHELRTPLASLRANAELYQQGALRSREQLDEVMRRIVAESQRMSGLVDGMLNLARLDQHPEQQREPVDLTGLVTDAVRLARACDPERAWVTDIGDGLTITGDELLLERAIGNLLANVTAHTPSGTVAKVAAYARGADGVVVVEVSDNGPGVAQDQLSRIFERFHRCPTSSRRPGSGLGLAIAAAVAAAHGGEARATLAAPGDPPGLRVTLTVLANPDYAR